MAMTQSVVIYYGPYNAYHTLSYKPHKVTGLRDRLRKLGFRVEMKPVKYENFCMLVLAGHEVFRCNIKNLKYNTPYNHDPVCQRAVEAVLEGAAKITRARNRLFFLMVLQDNIFVHRKYGFQDLNVSKSKIKGPKKLSRVEECMKCCGIMNGA